MHLSTHWHDTAAPPGKRPGRAFLAANGGHMRMQTFEDAHPPGDGPWASEPDKAQWIDKATGLDALAVRGHGGAWCGYVGVPPGHPWHGVDYSDIKGVEHPMLTDSGAVGVYNGLTYSDFCTGDEDGLSVCHTPEPGRPENVWWVGFHCASSWDIEPGREARDADKLLTSIGHPYMFHTEDATYKDFGFVRVEVAHLAQQAAAAR